MKIYRKNLSELSAAEYFDAETFIKVLPKDGSDSCWRVWIHQYSGQTFDEFFVKGLDKYIQSGDNGLLVEALTKAISKRDREVVSRFCDVFDDVFQVANSDGLEYFKEGDLVDTEIGTAYIVGILTNPTIIKYMVNGVEYEDNSVDFYGKRTDKVKTSEDEYEIKIKDIVTSVEALKEKYIKLKKYKEG